jgi:hypothetical protein
MLATTLSENTWEFGGLACKTLDIMLLRDFARKAEEHHAGRFAITIIRRFKAHMG